MGEWSEIAAATMGSRAVGRPDLRTDVRTPRNAGRIDEMAAALAASRLPSTEFVQGIEDLLTRQHAVTDRRARELGLLTELRKGDDARQPYARAYAREEIPMRRELGSLARAMS